MNPQDETHRQHATGIQSYELSQGYMMLKISQNINRNKYIDRLGSINISSSFTENCDFSDIFFGFGYLCISSYQLNLKLSYSINRNKVLG